MDKLQHLLFYFFIFSLSPPSPLSSPIKGEENNKNWERVRVRGNRNLQICLSIV
jgi:hypothetical protein